MRTYLLMIPVLLTAFPALANTITAKVDGMVCAFCAKGLEDKLKENANIDQVKISLEDGTVSITSKPDKILTPEDLTKAVFYMGYTTKDVQNN